MPGSKWLRVRVQQPGGGSKTETDVPRSHDSEDVEGHVYNGVFNEYEKAQGGIDPSPEQNVSKDRMVP